MNSVTPSQHLIGAEGCSFDKRVHKDTNVKPVCQEERRITGRDVAFP